MAKRSSKLKKKPGRVASVAGNSFSPQKDLVHLLKSHFPDVFTEGKVDPARLKKTLGEELAENGERYGLSWAGKTDCFGHIQETTTATLKPCRKESVDFDKTENIFIEGDNLEVLKVLQRTYYGKIKMIYIDPPYNTGNDSFIYPDRFKEEKEDYELRAGIKDAEGLLTKDGFWRKNSKDAGHFHSNWLSMMYPRLFLARNLLRPDGVIFVSIDDGEVHNLKTAMNDIFGEESFIAQFVWKSRQNKDNRNITGASIDHEYVLCYGTHIRGSERNSSQYKNPDNDPRGDWTSANMVGLLPAEQRPRCHYDLINPKTGINYGKPKMGWRYDPSTMQKLIEEDRIIWPKSAKGRPRRKVFFAQLKEEYAGYSSIVADGIYTRDGTTEFEELFAYRYMEFPKPTALMKELLEQGLGKDGIVLDFFAGSCSIAHAVMSLNSEDASNRKFICVQLAELCEEKSEAFNAGFKTIADIGKERIRRAAKKIKNETQGKLNFDGGKLDLGFKAFKLDQSNFKQWREEIKTPAEFKSHLYEMVDNVAKGAKPQDMLYEIILKNSLFDLNVKVEKKTFDGVDYYSLADGVEIICLASKITKKFVDKVLSEKPEKFTCLDTAFKNNDQLKTNTALQMEAAKIEFKVI
jgi:adenine-specific DNA-methyltransferase